MFIQHSATPKQILKIGSRVQTQDETEALIYVPEKWADFARTTRIKSGKGFVPFDPYPFQERFINLIDRPTEHDGMVLTIAAKTRQIGISETTVNYLLWKCLKTEGFSAVVFSRTGADSLMLARRCKTMIESLGLSLKTDSLSDQILPSGSSLHYRAPTNSGGRGLPSVSAVLVDEIAFIENVEELLSAVLPATEMCPDPRVIYVSTPNGQTGHFWDLLSQNNNFDVLDKIESIRKGECDPYVETFDNSGAAKALIHWRSHPVYSERDRLAQLRGEPGYLERIHITKKLTLEKVYREYDLAFTSGELSYFDPELVYSCATSEPESEHDATAEYFLGLDCSTTGDDYLVAPVLKWTDGKLSQIAMYRARKRGMDRHLEEISKLIKTYRIKKAAIEVTGGVGQLYWEKLTKLFPDVQFLKISTTQDSKALMLERIALLMERRQLEFCVGIIVDEMIALQIDGKKIQAPVGKHDDTVMGLAFAIAASPLSSEDSHLKFKTHTLSIFEH